MKGRNLSPGNSQQHKIPDLDIIDLEKENRSASQASDSPSDPQSADSPPASVHCPDVRCLAAFSRIL